jgi:hypothetical protein
MGRDVAVGTAVGSLTLKSVLRSAAWFSVSFSGLLHLDNRLNCVLLHVEDTRGEDTMWGAVRSRSLPHASKAPRQGWN